MKGNIGGKLNTGEDDGSHIQIDSLFLVIQTDGLGGAKLLACPALALFKKDAMLLVDRVLEGHGLGVLNVDRLALDQIFVEGVVHLLRALFGARPACYTLFHVHVAGMFDHLHGEISRFSADVSDF